MGFNEQRELNALPLEVGGLGVDAATFASHLDKKMVRGLPGMGSVVRFVTYRNISAEDVRQAIADVGELVAEKPWADS